MVVDKAEKGIEIDRAIGMIRDIRGDGGNLVEEIGLHRLQKCRAVGGKFKNNKEPVGSEMVP
jgi:hypothetical protein